MKQAPVSTERDMKRVLQHVARSGFPARNRCLLILSWLAGMRVAEIAALRFSDVVAATGEVRPEIQLSPGGYPAQCGMRAIPATTENASANLSGSWRVRRRRWLRRRR